MNIGTGATSVPLVTVIVLLVVVVLVTLVWSLRQLAGRRHGAASGVASVLPADEFSGFTTASLNARASAALVTIDDAVKTSEQELGFAEAQFGLEATATFGKALDAAKTSVARAFAIRQQLDDAFPETEPQARAMAAQIIQTCTQVGLDLDAHTQEFDALRDLQSRAPELLDEVTQRAADISRRIPAARTTLEDLSASYPATALASVGSNPDQVDRLMAGIAATVAVGRSALATGDREAAVRAARSGEAALAQAISLLDAVDHAEAALAAACRQLGETIASLSSDVIEAARLAPSDPVVNAQAATVTAAILRAQQERTGGDPLATLRTLTRTQAEFGASLAPFRARAAHDEHVRKRLEEMIAHASAQIDAVGAYIDSRRGAVGPEARTRLSEAARHTEQAQELATTDPDRALAEATQGGHLVDSAQVLAQQDVADFEQRQRQDTGRPAVDSLGNPVGMVLGGILIDQLLRGGGRGFGGGFGGGGGC
ncbi:MAG: hypothetical protein HHJ13_15080 [Phycicoccus sp.]|nr:hypothetical protein [Phycicoccus sp.]